MPGVNCWDHNQCAAKAECPAFPDHGYDCWNVEGTLCRGERQGEYLDKVPQCRTKCEFYSGVISGSIRIV